MTRLFTKNYDDLEGILTATQQRIYGKLEALSKKGSIELKYTQRKLAKICSVSVSTLKRALKKFHELKFIIKDYFKCKYERRIKALIRFIHNVLQTQVDSGLKMNHDVAQNEPHIYSNRETTDRDISDRRDISIICRENFKKEPSEKGDDLASDCLGGHPGQSPHPIGAVEKVSIAANPEAFIETSEVVASENCSADKWTLESALKSFSKEDYRVITRGERRDLLLELRDRYKCQDIFDVIIRKKEDCPELERRLADFLRWNKFAFPLELCADTSCTPWQLYI